MHEARAPAPRVAACRPTAPMAAASRNPASPTISDQPERPRADNPTCAAPARRPAAARCAAPKARAAATPAGTPRRHRAAAACTSRLADTSTLPQLGGSSPATIRSNVVLPQPLGPTMETNSPGAISSRTVSSAVSSWPSRVWNRRPTSTKRNRRPVRRRHAQRCRRLRAWLRSARGRNRCIWHRISALVKNCVPVDRLSGSGRLPRDSSGSSRKRPRDWLPHSKSTGSVSAAMSRSCALIIARSLANAFGSFGSFGARSGYCFQKILHRGFGIGHQKHRRLRGGAADASRSRRDSRRCTRGARTDCSCTGPSRRVVRAASRPDSPRSAGARCRR